LKDSIEKLTLNDSSVVVQRDSSSALGQGFRIGFLGMLHLDVFRQRLKEEYNADVILTNPSVSYKVLYRNGEFKIFNNPLDFPITDHNVVGFEEPYVRAFMIFPSEYIGPVMGLCEKRRGVQISVDHADGYKTKMQYHLPLSQCKISV
jgi:translation elongation factor EF-4